MHVDTDPPKMHTWECTFRLHHSAGSETWVQYWDSTTVSYTHLTLPTILLV